MKKQPNITIPTKHHEIKEYQHKGINVAVAIDYDIGTISLVESGKYAENNNRKAKQWLFAKRSIDFMGGWKNILDAMKFAIEMAEAELRVHLAAEEEKRLHFEVMISQNGKKILHEKQKV